METPLLNADRKAEPEVVKQSPLKLAARVIFTIVIFLVGELIMGRCIYLLAASARPFDATRSTSQHALDLMAGLGGTLAIICGVGIPLACMIIAMWPIFGATSSKNMREELTELKGAMLTGSIAAKVLCTIVWFVACSFVTCYIFMTLALMPVPVRYNEDGTRALTIEGFAGPLSMPIALPIGGGLFLAGWWVLWL